MRTGDVAPRFLRDLTEEETKLQPTSSRRAAGVGQVQGSGVGDSSLPWGLPASHHLPPPPSTPSSDPSTRAQAQPRFPGAQGLSLPGPRPGVAGLSSTPQQAVHPEVLQARQAQSRGSQMVSWGSSPCPASPVAAEGRLQSPAPARDLRPSQSSPHPLQGPSGPASTLPVLRKLLLPAPSQCWAPLIVKGCHTVRYSYGYHSDASHSSNHGPGHPGGLP